MMTFGAPSLLVNSTNRQAVRQLSWSDLGDALHAGWDDFKAMPSQLGFIGVIYPIVGLIAARAMFSDGVLSLVYPLICVLSLLGPVLATGLYELSRRRERGLATHPLDAFRVLQDPAMPAIAAIGVMLLGIAVLWLLAARAIFGLTIGAESDHIQGLVLVVFGTWGGWSLLVLGNAVGFLFAAVTLTLTVVSVPMILDRRIPPSQAIRSSVAVAMANPTVIGGWGLIVAGLLLLGCLPVFIGLAIVMPLLGHATWHLYRRAVP